jgi:hypothetical protein
MAGLQAGATMTIRSVVLFTHVVGMLVLFIGIAFEWLRLDRFDAPRHRSRHRHG